MGCGSSDSAIGRMQQLEDELRARSLLGSWWEKKTRGKYITMW